MSAKPSRRVLWLMLALSASAPLLITLLWGNVYADAAYDRFVQARAIATGQDWDSAGIPLLHTLLLAVANLLRLPVPAVAAGLSAVGWIAAVAGWFLTGLALDRPTFSLAAAVLLALHPQQGQALGLEPGLVLGLLGLATWSIERGRTGAGLVTMVVLTAVQPLALSLVLPLFVFRRAGRRTTRTLPPLAASIAIGAACYGLACALRGSWDEPRLTVPLVAALDLLGAAAFSFLVPSLDWLASPAANRQAVQRGIVVLALAALVVWQGSALTQDWRFRPVDRLEPYGRVAQWLRDHTLPSETVGAQQAGTMAYLSGRATVPLPAASKAPDLVSALDTARPDYCIALNSLVWQGLRSQPWFREHYGVVYQVASPYDTATPLTVLRYTPTPFDTGDVVSTTVTFASDTGAQIELTGYRVSSQRIAPGEPLHVTLYWRATAAIHQPLLLVVRLIDAATGLVWAQAENGEPGRLATNLWDTGTQLDDRYTLAPPASIPPGDYVLDAAFYLPSGRRLPAHGGEESAGTGTVFARVSRPPDVSPLPLTPDHPLSATFDRDIGLLGYDAAERVAPGQTLRVTLYWHAAQRVPLDYKVFVHLLGPGDQLLSQSDAIPVGWTYPTSSWKPGEHIRDQHLLTIPPSAQRGDYRLAVGLYDADTGKRSVVYDAAGSEIPERRVTLQSVEVR